MPARCETYRVACVRAGSHFTPPIASRQRRNRSTIPTPVNWTVIILYDLDTGEPLAFMHETYLSGFRVGATSALAVAEGGARGCRGARPVRHRQPGASRTAAPSVRCGRSGACRSTAPTRSIARRSSRSMASEKFEVVAVDDPREVVRGAAHRVLRHQCKGAGAQRRMARARPDGRHHRQFRRARYPPRGRRDDVRARQRHHHQRLGQRDRQPPGRAARADREGAGAARERARARRHRRRQGQAAPRSRDRSSTTRTIPASRCSSPPAARSCTAS